MVAEGKGLSGTAIVLFRPRSAVARLYSIAVAPHMSGKGVGGAVAQGDRAGGAAARLHHHPPRSPPDQPCRHRALPQAGIPGSSAGNRRYYDDGGDALRSTKIFSLLVTMSLAG